MDKTFDYSVSQFWNTASFRWEVVDVNDGRVVANGVSKDCNTAQLVAQNKIRQLNRAAEGAI